MWGALNADPGTPQGKSCVEGEVDIELLADVTAPSPRQKGPHCMPSAGKQHHFQQSSSTTPVFQSSIPEGSVLLKFNDSLQVISLSILSFFQESQRESRIYFCLKGYGH